MGKTDFKVFQGFSRFFKVFISPHTFTYRSDPQSVIVQVKVVWNGTTWEPRYLHQRGILSKKVPITVRVLGVAPYFLVTTTTLGVAKHKTHKTKQNNRSRTGLPTHSKKQQIYRTGLVRIDC